MRERAFGADAEDTFVVDVEGQEKIVTGSGVAREEWLILLANIWIVASMALIHRVACVGSYGHAPQAKLGKPERIEDKTGNRPLRVFTCRFARCNYSTSIQEFRY